MSKTRQLLPVLILLPLFPLFALEAYSGIKALFTGTGPAAERLQQQGPHTPITNLARGSAQAILSVDAMQIAAFVVIVVLALIVIGVMSSFFDFVGSLASDAAPRQVAAKGIVALVGILLLGGLMVLLFVGAG